MLSVSRLLRMITRMCSAKLSGSTPIPFKSEHLPWTPPCYRYEASGGSAAKLLGEIAPVIRAAQFVWSLGQAAVSVGADCFLSEGHSRYRSAYDISGAMCLSLEAVPHAAWHDTG